MKERRAPLLAYNRTIEELKYYSAFMPYFVRYSYNRTIEELKYA